MINLQIIQDNHCERTFQMNAKKIKYVKINEKLPFYNLDAYNP